MSSLRQIAVTVAASIGCIGSGLTLGFSAVALPVMENISEEESSWVASIASIGMPFGCLLIGPMVDGLGRKRTLMLVNLPALIGWICIATAYDPWYLKQIYVGRFLTGFSTFLACQPAIVYVGEVTDKKLRGILTTWIIVGVSLGVLIVYGLGALLMENWRLVAGISALLPALAIVVVWFTIPESPVWLSSRSRNEEAEKNLRNIRKVTRNQSLPGSMKLELETMIQSNKDNPTKMNWRDIMVFMRRPEAWKPFLIMNVFQFFQQFTGIFVVIFYLVNIVELTGVDFDSYLATVLIGVSRLIGAVMISFTTRNFGRRFLALFSGMGMILSLGVLVAYLNLAQRGTLSWIPITALVLYIFISTMGFLTLPFSMVGEVFPAKVRAWCSGVTTAMGCTFNFIIVKVYPDMISAWGLDYVLLFYAVMSIIGTIFVYLFLPETQGKTMEEIEMGFRGEAPVDVNKNGHVAINKSCQ